MKKLFFVILLAFLLLLSACTNANDIPDDGAEQTDEMSVDENEYIEGIFFSSDGAYPMILIGGTNPCYMRAVNSSVRFDGLTNGDRIRINNGVMLYTYPGQIRVSFVEKLADGEITDIDEAVIDELNKFTEFTVDTSALTKTQEITVISNDGGLDIKSVHIPIESKNIRCYSAAFDERYQMYFLTGGNITLHIVDMLDGVVAHTEKLNTDTCPSSVSYGADHVTVYDFTVNDDGSETVDCAFKISKSDDTFTVTAVQTDAYPEYGLPRTSSDGKYTVYMTTEDGMGHGGIDVRTEDGSVQQVYENVVFDAHVGGSIADISDVAVYEPVGFISDTEFVYNIYGWEHHVGFGIYDFATDESVYFKSGEFVVHDVHGDKIMVEERGPYHDVRISQALWSVDADGNYSLLASQAETSENPNTYVLGEHFYCYFDDGVWLNFKTNIDIGEADVKRIEILSADFTEVLAEIEYPYGEVIFYLDENLKATKNSVTVIFFDINTQ